MKLKITKQITLPNTGSVLLNLDNPIEKYIVIGSPTLIGNVNFIPSGTSPVEGTTIDINYLATPTLSGNTITILGKNITAIANKMIMLQAVFIDGTWQIAYSNFNDVDPGKTPIKASEIDAEAVTSEKIALGAVTVGKLDATATTVPITYLYDSNTAAIRQKVALFIPFKHQLISMFVSCIEGITTDALTYDLAVKGMVAFSGTLPTSVAAGSQIVEPFGDTAAFKSNSGGAIEFRPTKSTAGGILALTFVVKRIV